MNLRRIARRLADHLPWLVPAGFGALLALSGGPLIERLRDFGFDNYQSVAPRAWSPDLPVRVIDIDDESLNRLGQWPWPRDRLAAMTAELTRLEAAAIAFDVIFAEPDRTSPENVIASLPDRPERRALEDSLRGEPGHDTRFADAVAQAPAVLALALANGGGKDVPPVRTGFATAGDDPRLFIRHFGFAVRPLPALMEAAKGLGAINFQPDRDLVVRKVPLILAMNSLESASPLEATLVPSLDAEVLRVAQGASTILVKSSGASGEEAFGAQTGIVAIKIGDFEIPTEKDGTVRVRYAGSQKGRHIPAWRLIAGEVKPDEIAGRIALIGASATALSDLRSTPLEGAVPGIDIHAELIEHIASGARLARPDYAPGFEAFVLVIGAAVTGWLARHMRPVPAAVSGLAMVALAIGGSFLAFLKLDALFDPLVPGATWIACYAATTLIVYRRSERERQSVRNAFSRYLAPAIVEQLAENPGQLKLGGETRQVTILFSDLRNFTSRSETMSAAEVVEFLNRLHTPLTAAVLAEGGTVDKYIGDGLMAFWNAPLDQPDHALRACRAALAMQRALPAIDAELDALARAAGRIHEPLILGIGINTGEAFVGNMGSEQRFDYSIVGDAVNVAARLEAATKDFAAPVIVSEATREAAQGLTFETLGGIELRGKKASTRIFALRA